MSFSISKILCFRPKTQQSHLNLMSSLSNSTNDFDMASFKIIIAVGRSKKLSMHSLLLASFKKRFMASPGYPLLAMCNALWTDSSKGLQVDILISAVST